MELGTLWDFSLLLWLWRMEWGGGGGWHGTRIKWGKEVFFLFLLSSRIKYVGWWASKIHQCGKRELSWGCGIELHMQALEPGCLDSQWGILTGDLKMLCPFYPLVFLSVKMAIGITLSVIRLLGDKWGMPWEQADCTQHVPTALMRTSPKWDCTSFKILCSVWLQIAMIKLEAHVLVYSTDFMLMVHRNVISILEDILVRTRSYYNINTKNRTQESSCFAHWLWEPVSRSLDKRDSWKKKQLRSRNLTAAESPEINSLEGCGKQGCGLEESYMAWTTRWESSAWEIGGMRILSCHLRTFIAIMFTFQRQPSCQPAVVYWCDDQQHTHVCWLVRISSHSLCLPVIFHFSLLLFNGRIWKDFNDLNKWYKREWRKKWKEERKISWKPKGWANSTVERQFV